MKSNLIYDVGMFNGDDTAYYLSKGFRVIAIEANPSVAEQTSRRFEREIAAKDLIILNVGVSDHEGETLFYVSDANPDWNTFNANVVQEKDTTAFREITVPCRRFRSILDEFGTPYYLKLDIEGNEIHCLRDLIVSDLPEYVSFEKSANSTIESLNLLHDLGYKGFKLISQQDFLPVEYPPSREQKRFEAWRTLTKSRNIFLRAIRKAGVGRGASPTRTRPGWTFPQGSSGPFGEDTPGKWQTLNEMLATLAKANASFEAREASVFWGDQGYSFWADFHAKKAVN